jgi:pyruvate/2-oxoglutarate dehydrogenase complex dihydrolipoamide acyltransferase (E2) component
MVYVIKAPQIDVNDELMLVAEISAKVGDLVHEDTEIAVIESSKAAISITPDKKGIVRHILVKEGQKISVQKPMFVIADSTEEYIPEDIFQEKQNTEDLAAPSGELRVTAKARMLAEEHGVDLGEVQVSSRIIRKTDVLDYIKKNQALHSEIQPQYSVDMPTVPYRKEKMSNIACGMPTNLLWHKSEAIPAYLEKAIDIQPLIGLAKELKVEKSLLFDPLFPLFSWYFVQSVLAQGDLNAVYFQKEILLYEKLNLGFTIDVSGDLYLAVLHDADKYDMGSFIEAMFSLQLKAMRRRLSKTELSGCTIGVTSLSSYGVTRHQPILPPFTSLMLSYSDIQPTSPPNRSFVAIGVTYDHRVHTGARVAMLLGKLSRLISKIDCREK